MTSRCKGKPLYQFIAEHGELRNEQDCTRIQAMTYKLPGPAHRGPLGTGAYFDSFTADQMQAAFESGQRDMLERAVAMGDSICAKSTSLGGEDMLIPDLLDELKELLNEQH